MTSPLRVIIAGQLLCVLPYAGLGPSPPLRPILAAAGLLGPWMIWVSLVLLGAGCAFCLMPVLPAILAAADKVRSWQQDFIALNATHLAVSTLLQGELLFGRQT